MIPYLLFVFVVFISGVFLGSAAGHKKATEETKEAQNEYELTSMDEKYRCKCEHLVREHSMWDPGCCLVPGCDCFIYTQKNE